MLQVSKPYVNLEGKEVILLTYTDGHTEECDYIRVSKNKKS